MKRRCISIDMYTVKNTETRSGQIEVMETDAGSSGWRVIGLAEQHFAVSIAGSRRGTTVPMRRQAKGQLGILNSRLDPIIDSRNMLFLYII